METKYEETEIVNKYYLKGKQISAIEKDQILHGKRKESFRGHGIPEIETTDHFKTKDGGLDIEDPLLKESLETIKLPIEKTFISLFNYDNGAVNPLIRAKKSAIYACW